MNTSEKELNELNEDGILTSITKCNTMYLSNQTAG